MTIKKLATTLVVAWLALVGCDSDDTVPTTVDDDGVQCAKAEYTSIQEAVDAAAPGETIQVCPGTYTGTVVIPATHAGLALVGSGGLPMARIGDPQLESILEGSDPEAAGFTVQADGVSILGFTIQNTERSGIEVLSGGDVTISGITIGGNYLEDIGDPNEPGVDCAGGRGINVEMASNVVVEDNVIVSPCGAGIRFRAVTGSTIQNNDIDGSRKRPGIAIRNGSTGSTILANLSWNNREAGISVQDSTDNHIEGNTMQDNGVVGDPLREIPGPGSNTDADDTTNPPLPNPPHNTWQNNLCTTTNRAGLC